MLTPRYLSKCVFSFQSGVVVAMDGAENRFENPLYAVVEARKVELSVPSTEPLPDNTELTIQQQEQIEEKNEIEI